MHGLVVFYQSRGLLLHSALVWSANACAMAECDWADTGTVYIRDVLRPLEVRHLGHLGIAVAAGQGAAQYECFRRSVLDAFGEDIAEQSFTEARGRVMSQWPGLLGLSQDAGADVPLTVGDVLRPLQVRHLYHLGVAMAADDELGQCEVFRRGVMEAFGDDVDEFSFNQARCRVLRHWPELVGLSQSANATVPSNFVQHVDIVGPCIEVCSFPGCGWPLGVIRKVKSTFLTLARGMVRGQVAMSKCSNPSCRSVHCGVWRWDDVPAWATSGSSKQGLPGTQWHHPTCVMGEAHLDSIKWFFADPYFVVEAALIKMLMGLMCRGGMSLTAFHEVYEKHSCAENVPLQYRGDGQDFTKHMLQVIVVWGVVILLLEMTPLALLHVEWNLHGGKHRDADFSALVRPAMAAFQAFVQRHNCELFRRTGALVSDGKWGFQSILCGDRRSMSYFDLALGMGFHCGCPQRPARGEVFCQKHLADIGRHGGKCTKKGCLEEPVAGNIFCSAHLGSDTSITESRSRYNSKGEQWMEYKDDGSWVRESELGTAAVKQFEQFKLRKRPADSYHRAKKDGACGKDPRKEVPEVDVPQKSFGVLTVVCACHFIYAIQPMLASESCTQLAMLVSQVVGWLSGVTYVLYDNACGVRRFLNNAVKRCRDRGEQPPAALLALAALHLVIERLHVRYHRGCRLEGTGWYEPTTDPHIYPSLVGLNTQANEQVFSMIDRWMRTLNATGLVKHKLLLLLFARYHNGRVDPDKAWRRYERAQASGVVPVVPAIPAGVNVGKDDCGDDVGGGQLLGKRQRQGKKPVSGPEGCDDVARGVGAMPDAMADGQVRRRFRLDDEVVVNPASNKMHLVHPHFTNSSTLCSRWSFFGKGIDAQQLRSLLLMNPDVKYVVCGSCCGARDALLETVLDEDLA